MSDTVSTPMLEGVRRIEIFTGAGRRRRWSSGEKALILTECERSGDTVTLPPVFIQRLESGG